MKKAARAVGEKHVEMVPVKEINKVTGYIRGGCTPIGMKKQYTTVIHESAKQQDKIAVKRRKKRRTDSSAAGGFSEGIRGDFCGYY